MKDEISNIKINKSTFDKIDLSDLTKKEIYELGYKTAVREFQRPIDDEILELNLLLDEMKRLKDSILSRLKNDQLPTLPSEYDDCDDEELKKIQLPLDIFKEIVIYYIEDYDITDIEDLKNENNYLFQFIVMNANYYHMTLVDINKLYHENKSE